MQVYIIIAKCRGLEDRCVVLDFDGRAVVGLIGQPIRFTKAMAESALRFWSSRPNCSHLEFSIEKM